MDQQQTTNPPAAPEPAPTGNESDEQNDLIADEMLVEEISIDGMCGVY